MMADFLKSQLDYIFFFYGAAFLLLVPICLFLRKRSCRKLPWIWLAWFGAIHGVYEWLTLLALSLEPGPVFDFVRLGVLIMSFVCLVEFGRAGTRTIGGRGPGHWILAAMVALAGVGGLAGVAGLFAATRYVLGLGGGLWAARALFLAARTKPSGSRPLQIGACGMAGYALAAGLVVRSAPFFPAAWLNYDSFLAVTGVPIQLIRGLIAISISASLGLFAQTCLEKDHHFRVWFRHLMMGAMAGLALLLITGWVFTQYLGDIAARDKWDDYEHDAENVRRSLTDKMVEADRLVKTISGSPVIYSLLASKAPQTIQQANTVLDVCSQTLPESVCYLMDLHGLTTAASNRDHPDSFVGKSYAFRPYFQQALQGSAGRYWALGVTSKELGYYASFPVRDKAGQIIGAAVIKRVFVEMQASIHNHCLGLIIDQRGIVVMANRPEMILKSLWPLTAAEMNDLLASRQFGDGPFPPILTQKPMDKSECLLQGKRQMVLIRPILYEGCSVVVFGSVWPITQARLLGISATLLLCLLLIGFLTIVVIIWESEGGFRQLFENAADILILHDKGKVIKVNQQACHSLGYTLQELLGLSIFDIEVGYSKEFLIDLWEKGGDVVTLSGIYRRKDGSIFPTEIRVGEITYRGQTLRLAAARDVTERKRAEGALQAERQRLYNLLDRLQAYIYLRRPDYSLVYMNKNFRERFGDPANRPCYQILHGRQQPCEVCPCSKVFETGKPEEWEWTSKSGRTYHLYAYPFADVDSSPLVLEMGIDITQHKRAEEALRTSKEALRKSKESYRNLAAHLLTAQEAERKRLARELHDDLSQQLAGLAMEAEMLQQQMPPQGADAVRLKEMKDNLVKLSIDVHAMSRRLHPSILDDLGLPDAIASECARFQRQDSIAVNFKAENLTREVPPDVAVCLYRIVQEGLRNISRHAGAKEVTISLVGKDHTIHLAIMDNGRGFDPDRVKGPGLGLDSMKERAYLIGGDFSIKSQPGQGTVIEVLVPLSRSPV